MTPSLHPRNRGFTLVEILTVMAIVALLVALAVPLTSSFGDSKQVSTEADSITSQIAYAQLLATSSNQPVELRFYLKPVTETRPDETYVRATQIMVTNGDKVFQPNGRIRDMEGKVVIHPSEEFSSIIAGEANPPDPKARDLGNRVAESLEYHAIRFLPSGSTSLGHGSTEQYWSLTFVSWSPVLSDSELPDDFVTLQMDPFTGKVRRYEPGQ